MKKLESDINNEMHCSVATTENKDLVAQEYDSSESK